MSSDDLNGLEAFGIWHVTTEGDCEGRTTRDLGVHEGYLDEIAFDLAPQAEYTLTFNPPEAAHVRTAVPSLHDHVNVNMGYRFGLSSMTEPGRANFFKRLLEGRPVQVESSNFYASATLKRTITPEMKAQAEALALKLKREAALAKLTPAERKLLGVDRK